MFSIIIRTRLKNGLIYMSDLEADLCALQMAHLASDQEGTLGKTAAEDSFGSCHLSVNNDWA